MTNAPHTDGTSTTPSASTTSSARRRTIAVVAAIGAVVLAGGCAAGARDTRGAGTPPPSPATAPATAPLTTPLPAESTTTGAGTSTAGAPYTSAITDEPVANPAFARLGNDISRRIEQAGLPGASLLVLDDGQLVEQEAFGGYTLDTAVPIASASKWLSGATLMSLVDDGLIDLDAPISTYLPDATGPSGRITTRQLVSFTSGLEYDERIPCYEDKSVTLEACNRQILDLPLLAPPGSGYRYTGTHLHVAAGIAQAVTGQTWEQIFQERIAGPLGMTKTTFTASPIATAADGHPAPAGSAVSTLGDYGRFLEMLVHDGVAPDGTRVLSPDALAEMSRDQTGDAKFVSAAANRKAAETPYGVAHWLDMVRPDGTALVESSPGKFGFRPWIDRVNGIAGVYLVVDKDDSHVSDSPDRSRGDAGVQTGGTFVIDGTVSALGGTKLDLLD